MVHYDVKKGFHINNLSYLTIINHKHPDVFGFDLETAVECAREINPDAITAVRRRVEDEGVLSASDLARIFCGFDPASSLSRPEKRALAKKRLRDYWCSIGMSA